MSNKINIMNTTKYKRQINLMQYLYACLVFKDFEKIEKILDKKGRFLGMSYNRFLLFLRVEFEKSHEEYLFDLDGILKGYHVDIGRHAGSLCFLFKKFLDSKGNYSALLFIPNETGNHIIAIKRSEKVTTEKNFNRMTKQYTGENGKKYNLIFKN